MKIWSLAQLKRKMEFAARYINNRGKINAKELGNVLGSGEDNVEENVWQEMIDEADIDKDGEINFDDFKGIMEKC